MYTILYTATTGLVLFWFYCAWCLCKENGLHTSLSVQAKRRKLQFLKFVCKKISWPSCKVSQWCLDLHRLHVRVDRQLDEMNDVRPLSIAGNNHFVRAKEDQDWNARMLEKQASRDKDADDLASGRKTAEQLRQENGKFAFPNAKVDLLSAKRVW